MLPQEDKDAWKQVEGPAIFVTSDSDGLPNAIFVKCLRLHEQDCFVIADNFFTKTKTNILAGSHAALLFITSEGTSFQVKGRLEYHTSGAFFDYMKSWNPKHLAGKAATILYIESAFQGSNKLDLPKGS